MTIPAPASVFATGKQRKRGKGSRAQLATRFFADVYAAWEEQGEAVIARAAFHDPVAFMNMVARLMPQKIEVSTPTDGMSDERLAELLDLAERMASLKASAIEGHAVPVLPALAHQLDDENGLCGDLAEGAGWGADRAGVAAGGGSTSTIRADSADRSESMHNPLDEAPDLPYPVGRAQPLSDVEVARLNRAKLIQAPAHSASEPESHLSIDPASLF